MAKKIKIKINGQTFKSIQECADFFNVNYNTFYSHYKKGVPIDLIIARYSQRIKYIDHNGTEYNSLSEMLKDYNIPKSTYRSRKRQKWTLKQILTTQIKQFEYDGTQYHSLLDFCKKNKISEKWIPLLREILKK